jgi:peptide/nickel transport system permease protein
VGVETAGPAARGARRTGTGRLAAAFRRVAQNRLALTGVVLVLVETAIAVLAPWLAPSDPSAIDYRAMLAGPSAAHLLGTDDLGRDVLSRLVHGARVSLGVGVTSVLLAAAAGVPLGLLTG